jgi:amino acid transporter
MLKKLIPALLVAVVGASLSQGHITQNNLIIATSQKGSSITQKDVQKLYAYTQVQTLLSSVAVGFGGGLMTFLLIEAIAATLGKAEKSPQEKKIAQLEGTIATMKQVRLQSPSSMSDEELRVFAAQPIKH